MKCHYSVVTGDSSTVSGLASPPLQTLSHSLLVDGGGGTVQQIPVRGDSVLPASSLNHTVATPHFCNLCYIQRE